MEATVFVRQLNSIEYSKLGTFKFSALPRINEFVSAEHEGAQKNFQVLAVNHVVDKSVGTEIYAVQTEPTWVVKKGRSIGFG